MATYTVRVVFHGSADHRPGKARPRLSSFLCDLRVLRGAHCDWIASLLNATGAIPHEDFDGSTLHQVFADPTVLERHKAYVGFGDRLLSTHQQVIEHNSFNGEP